MMLHIIVLNGERALPCPAQGHIMLRYVKKYCGVSRWGLPSSAHKAGEHI